MMRYYAEEFGIVEQHNHCSYCGYREEQCYSDTVTGFDFPLRRGYKDADGKYHPNEMRRFKRLRRKYGIKLDLNFQIAFG